jgi:hypothetical protein
VGGSKRCKKIRMRNQAIAVLKEYAGDPILQPLDLPSFGTSPPVMEGSTLESVDTSLTTSYVSFAYMRWCLKHF